MELNLMKHDYLPSLKRRRLADYNTDIIDRLYQTIEKRDWCPLSVYSKVPLDIIVTVEAMEFIQTSMI